MEYIYPIQIFCDFFLQNGDNLWKEWMKLMFLCRF